MLIVDVNNLPLGEQLNFNCKSDLDINGSDVPAKVDVRGIISRTKEGYILNGSIDAVLSLNCDLCLDNFTVALDIKLDEIFVSDTIPADNDKEYWSFSDKIIDLKPAVVANILLNMPMRAVCSDNCKGLCPKCGHNLNKGDCGCDRAYSNPAFEKLMTLFGDEE